MRQNKEIWVGVVLTALLGFLLLFVHARSVRNAEDSRFHLYAQFSKADGLMNGAAVRIGGMPVGEVVAQTLAEGYQVRVLMAFDKPVQVPTDSSLSIETDGLLGAKHIEILPGGDEEMLADGEMIDYTQDSLILGELIEKVNLYMKDKKEKENVK